MKTYALEDLKPGMRVVFVDDRLNAGHDSYVEMLPETSGPALRGRVAIVVLVQDVPGKKIGLCFKENVGGHTCDGRVPEGHGMWALPQNLYSEDAWEEHKAMAAEDVIAQKKIDDLLAGFVE